MRKTAVENSSKTSNNQSGKHDNKKSDNTPSKSVGLSMNRCIHTQASYSDNSSDNMSKVRRNHSIEDDQSDEDGGVKPKSISTITKMIPSKQPRLTTIENSSSTSKITHHTDEDDEDGGPDVKKILRQQRQAEVKKKPKQTLARQPCVSDEDDGAITTNKPKTEAKTKKHDKTEVKKKSKLSACINVQESDKKTHTDDDDDDDDGAPKRSQSMKKTKTSDTNKRVAKSNVSDDDGSFIVRSDTTIKHLVPSKQPKLINQSTKKETTSHTIDSHHKRSSKHHQTTTSTSHSTVDKLLSTTTTKAEHIRRKSTKKERHHDPIPSEEETVSQSSTTKPSASNQRRSRPIHSHRLRTNSYCKAQQNSTSLLPRESSPTRRHSNTGHDTTHSSASSIDDDAFKTIDASESTKNAFHPLSNDSDKQQTQFITTITAEDVERMERRARTRWNLAYTVISNHHVFDLRKDAPNRLVFLRSQQSTPTDQQHVQTIPVDQEPTASTSLTQPEELPQENQQAPTTASHSTQQPSPGVVNRLLSLPLMNAPQLSLVEQYVAARTSMLHDDTKLQTKIHLNPSLSEGPAGISPHQSPTNTPLKFFAVSDSSGSSPTSTTVSSGEPNGTSTELTSSSKHSTAESSIGNSSILRFHLSHEQFMQVWHRNQLKRIQRKRRHSYIYGSSVRPLFIDRISTIAILTPQHVSDNSFPPQVSSASVSK